MHIRAILIRCFYGTYGTDPGFQFSENNLTGIGGANPPGDRRIVGSFGTAPLAAGNKLTYHSAILAGKRAKGDGQSQIDLFAKAKHVRKAFEDNATSCGQTFGNTTQDQVTAVPDIAKPLEFKVYPNPVSGNLHILISGNGGNGFVQLFDINGKAVMSESISSTNHTIGTSQLEKGLYLLK